jgi:hypothetical protein
LRSGLAAKMPMDVYLCELECDVRIAHWLPQKASFNVYKKALELHLLPAILAPLWT